MKSTRSFLGEEPPSKKRRTDDKPISTLPLAGGTLNLLQQLPEELLVMIFERLSSKADLQSAVRVCKQFNNVIKNPYLWNKLPWPEKDYGRSPQVIDGVFDVQRVCELVNGDIAVLQTNGLFWLIPVATKEWRLFQGHLDPYNFYTSIPIKHIISLQHNQLATCAEDGICIWDRMTGGLIQYLPMPESAVKPFKLLCTKTNGLVSAASDGSIYLHQDDGTSPTLFETSDIGELGKLNNLCFWRKEIIGEFKSAIISWNYFGRLATTRVIIEELHEKLIKQIRDLLADQKFMSLGIISANDITTFNNPANEGLTFNWDFVCPDNLVEVTYNKTFNFMIDLFSDKPPIFMSVCSKRTLAHDANNNYFMVRQLLSNRYDALYNWSSQERKYKSMAELVINEPIKSFFSQPTGHALFVLYDNAAILWNIKLNVSHKIQLQIPNVPLHLMDLYEYGSDDWKFKLLLHSEVLGIHKLGIIIIWDMHTGNIKQHLVPGYITDPNHEQCVTQIRNKDLLVSRREEARVNADGSLVNPQNHVCIYRFHQPLHVKQDDMEWESDILGLAKKR